MSALAELRNRFRPVLATLTDDVDAVLAMIRPAQDARFGDFQANCAMPLAKQLGQQPRAIAQQIVERLQIEDLCDAPEIAGPGFINLKLRQDWLEAAARRLVTDDRAGVEVAAPRKYVVDYSSPNVAKPMHVGHLRSSVIGNALDRILRFAGHEVIADNHIGDWGTQFGMIIYGYRNFVDQAAYQRAPVQELARLYRLVNQLCDYHEAVEKLPRAEAQIIEQNSRIAAVEASKDDPKEQKKALKKLRSDLETLVETRQSLSGKVADVDGDPTLRAMAADHADIRRDSRLETAKLHAGDAANQALWDEFLPECLQALESVYTKLGIRFDKALGESFYQPMLGDVVSSLQQSGMAVESDGATCVFIEGNEAPFIVRKSDGAYTYATTDLATIRYRVEEFGTQAMLYVVDTRQSEHFNLLFATARRWGYDGVEFRHVNFGTVLDPVSKKPYKTRSGDTVGLESLLDEAVERAYRVVSNNDDEKKDGPELDEATRRSVAEAVGIGGIKYSDLHHNRESDYAFDWDRMLATTGNTAAYIQYANARMHGIFRKGEIDREALRTQVATLHLDDDSERALVLQLQSFGDAIDATIAELRPSVLTQFLFETANRFTSFYSECVVLKHEDERVRTSRLLLCDITQRVLALGLNLLGIDAPEQM